MKVQVETLPWLSEQLRPGSSGALLWQAEGATLRQALQHLALADETFARIVFDVDRQHPRDHVQLLHNDRVVAWLREADLPLAEDDRITVLPAFAGG